jgi:hypothetical protein
MRLRPAFFAVTLAAVISCWFAVRAQQQTPAGADRASSQPAFHPALEPVFLDPTQVTAIAAEIAQRSERLKPLFEQVHAAEWVSQGAPDAYVSQWNSLSEQNAAIEADMTGIAQHPEAMSDVIKALFRVHRFDADLAGMLNGVRRYRNSSLADLIESATAGDQRGVDRLQQYVLDLANQKEQLLDIEDKEAQRCRSNLANQPIARPAVPKKTNGPSK